MVKDKRGGGTAQVSQLQQKTGRRSERGNEQERKQRRTRRRRQQIGGTRER